jgi:hypothetical protein
VFPYCYTEPLGFDSRLFEGILELINSPTHLILGARGGVVAKALRYKPVGRVFDWNFSVI